MQSELIIKLLNGNEYKGLLNQDFDPTSGRIDFFCTTRQHNDILPLSEICFIKFVGQPEQFDSPDENEFLEDIFTVTGNQFHLRLKKSGKRRAQGFYGYPVEPDSNFKSIFLTAGGLKGSGHDQPIGEVLRRQGLVDKADLDEALTEQQNLRRRRVGEILADNVEIPQAVIDQTIVHVAQKTSKNQQIRVGDILVEAGLVSKLQVEDALREQTTGKRKRLGVILVERGLITEDQLLSALAHKFGLQVVDLDTITINQEVLNEVPREMIERMQILPISLHNNCLTVATSTPTDPTISENLSFAINHKIKLVCASATKIGEKIAALYDRNEESIKLLIDELSEIDVEIDDVPELEIVTESDSKVIKLVNRVLLEAHTKGASDIHFEPGMGARPLKIRYRKDGICYTTHQISAAYKKAVLSRLKIVAKLDIAERRRPQTGKIILRHGTQRIEFRVEITPTIGGQEDAVLRVLSSSLVFPLDGLGFSANNLKRFKSILYKPYGIVLCVGPTGSGKTTSLHSALAEINKPDVKIWTAEDPVEITQEGLRQVQVHPKIGFNFEEALRSFLRADPDVIMIGEMRDISTAKTAIGASLTGHRVFSTLHTNNAPETVVRLIEMGIDPFNFSDAMLGILAQRLVRCLCNSCKKPYHPSRKEYDEYVEMYGPELFQEDALPDYSEDLTLMKKVGCKVCDEQGYSGRMALQELLVNSTKIKTAIKKRAGVETIAKIATQQGMRSLRMDGIQKIFLGLTDYEQVNKVSL